VKPDALVRKRTVTRETVKKFAVRSTRTSAQLERRAVPDGYVRSAQVEQFLAKRRTQA
jgi:hypothetical protein